MNKSQRVLSIFVSAFIIFCLMSTLTGCGTKLDKYYNYTNHSETNGPTIDKESYAVSLAFPAQNQTFESTDPPPIFYWEVHEGLPQTFIIEIDYMNDGSYMVGTATGAITYLLPENDWETIKSNAPVVDGLQKIHWRIRIDYTLNPDDGAYYSGWNYFWIKTE